MSRSRRGFWPIILLCFFLFCLLYRLHPTYYETASPLEVLSLPIESSILHPGDFVDPAGYPHPYIAPVQDSALREPEGEGTLNDVPWVVMVYMEFVSNAVIGKIGSTEGVHLL